MTASEREESASIGYDGSIPDPIANTIISVEVKTKSEQVSFDRAPTVEVRASIGGEPVADPAVIEILPGTNKASVRLK